MLPHQEDHQQGDACKKDEFHVKELFDVDDDEPVAEDELTTGTNLCRFL